MSSAGSVLRQEHQRQEQQQEHQRHELCLPTKLHIISVMVLVAFVHREPVISFDRVGGQRGWEALMVFDGA